MQKVLESSIVKSIITTLHERGIWAVKVHGGPTQVRGLPDIVAICSGIAIGLEVKRLGGQPTAIQKYNLDKMAEAGAVTGCVHSVEESLELLQKAGLLLI